MMCNSCRRTFVSCLRRPQVRAIATGPATPATSDAGLPSPPLSIDKHNPVTSSATPGISQPLSTPLMPSISTSKPAKPLKKTQLAGSIPGGQELKGLAYLKAKPHVLAKEDDEYPEWLWKLLDEGKSADGKIAVDLTALTKKQRAKYERKQAKLMRDVPQPIPLHEQSKDLTLPGDDAALSLERRQEITKSSRNARRKGIREDNFLRGM